MKFILGILLVAWLFRRWPTPTGVASDVKHFHNGGVAVDLDGHWPHEKTALYVPPADATTGGCSTGRG